MRRAGRAFPSRSKCYGAAMAVTLLRTETIFSLEFAMEDKTDVWAAIQELYGQPKVTPEVISATVRIDGEGFDPDCR